MGEITGAVLGRSIKEDRVLGVGAGEGEEGAEDPGDDIWRRMEAVEQSSIDFLRRLFSVCGGGERSEREC